MYIEGLTDEILALGLGIETKGLVTLYLDSILALGSTYSRKTIVIITACEWRRSALCMIVCLHAKQDTNGGSDWQRQEDGTYKPSKHGCSIQ